MKKPEPKINLDKVRDLYDKNIDAYGLDSKSVGWPTGDSQNLRFEKLLSVIDNKQQPVTINELGCGYGELFKYAIRENYSLEKFYGYDISQKMLDSAKEYLQDSRVELVNAARINTKADYTITSGIFNVKFEEKADQWDQYIKDTLENMFEYSAKGISFNLLTSYVDFEAKDLFYANPMTYFDFCKRKLSRYVSLLHDYPLYEWTIIVKK